MGGLGLGLATLLAISVALCSASFEVLAFYAYGPLETGASRPLLTDLHIQK